MIDLYSCFPSAVEAATAALGLATDDRRGLTVTGGLPYFGGPGNNYTTHAIATLTDRLRDRSEDDARGPQFGLATGLGWFITKHALGLYATEPPPGGFRRGDTAAAQEIIDATAAPMALEVADSTAATLVAATLVREGGGSDGIGPATAAPAFVRLPDGRQMAVSPADDHVLDEIGALRRPRSRRDRPSRRAGATALPSALTESASTDRSHELAVDRATMEEPSCPTK